MALKLVRSLLSNASLHKDRFMVVYRDSFAGLLEEPLNAFSWNFESDFGWCPIVVPGWQIEQLKYNSRVVWSKTLERPFDEVYRLCLETEQGTKHVRSPKSFSEASQEEEYARVVLKPFLMTTHITPGDLSDVFWNKPNTYNFFLCQRVCSSEFIDKAELIQKRMCDLEQQFAKCLYSPAMFHLTLCILSLADLPAVEDCFSTLKDICEQYQNLLPTDPLHLYGVDTFNRRVLYASFKPNEELRAFVHQIQLSLRSEGFQVDGNEHFVPHVTLLKLNRKRQRDCRIKPEMFEEFKSTDFGSLMLREFHLCLMGKARDEDGFYRNYGSIRFMDAPSGSEADD
ncbi:A-kinase anchor protein 7 isoform gamma [Clonorchis sinensis]|uniref:A-kinase anchor protein 7 isoform gamma n=1 Tax=Clonorchis sinensis TaxID=79923 RepID=H2KUZ7_CLOSI|nr:A-kinase anchor protein 7 isoform gamma [Clonorchis sinensis]